MIVQDENYAGSHPCNKSAYSCREENPVVGNLCMDIPVLHNGTDKKKLVELASF